MTIEACPGNITISGFEDIQDGPFRQCDGPIDNLIITDVIDEQLNFTLRQPLAFISNILIQDNPELEKIQLPILGFKLTETPQMGRIEIAGNPALRDIDCSHFSEYSPKNFSISDMSDGTLNFSNHASADQIFLYNSAKVSILDLPELNYLKSVGSSFATTNVPTIHIMEVQAPDTKVWDLSGLQRVDTAIWTNISIGAMTVDAYEIREDMVVGPSIFDKPPPLLSIAPAPKITAPPSVLSSMRFNNLTSIGRDLNITENMFITIDFLDLKEVSGNLNIMDNVNCTLNFNSTTRIGSLYAVNNSNTSLPGWFPELEEADSIYLNGFIDTSGGSNIFPSLKIVHNSIRLEPWNPDFNCTHFLAQASNLGFGGTSYCNSTADDSEITPESVPTSSNAASDAPTSQTPTSNSSSPPSAQSTSSTSALSPGGWAGIGAGIAVVLLGGGVLAYLLLRLATYKKKLRRQQQQQQQGHEGQEGQDANGNPADGPEQKETATTGVIRYEADGAQIVESASRQLAPQPRELGNTAVPAEMGAPRLSVELP